jgi:hypothetical protein
MLGVRRGTVSLTAGVLQQLRRVGLLPDPDDDIADSGP